MSDHVVPPRVEPEGLPVGFHPGLIRSVSTVATEIIREAIMDGRLEPGRRLKEGELATQLGISRTPVRQALHMLESEGLVVSEPNRGAAVKSYTPEELRDLYQLRALLEGFGARLAAERISDEGINALKESCARFSQLRERGDDAVSELVKENLHFHKLVMDAAGNRWLTYLTERVTNLPLVYRAYYWYSPDLRLISEHYHRQLTNALTARDGERAELVMKQHILEAKDFLVTRFSADSQERNENDGST